MCAETSHTERIHLSDELRILLPHLQFHLNVFHPSLPKMSPKAANWK